MGEKYYKYKLAKMKKYVLISFLFINISQTTCVNNAHKTNHVADVQQNNHENHVSEEHNFIWEISHNKLINRIQNNMFPSHTLLKVNS